MTKEEIEDEFEQWNENGYWIKDEVVDFVLFIMKGAVIEEREACAKECDDLRENRPTTDRGLLIATECAEAIRLRTTTGE